MKRANDKEATVAIIVNGDKLEKDCVQLKNMETGEQKEVQLALIEQQLKIYK